MLFPETSPSIPYHIDNLQHTHFIMKIEHSYHWKKQRKYRPEITDDIIELCIINSEKLKNKKWENAFNAITRIPPSGRILKVVYREESKNIKVITAFWLD
jgi:hypothetical protein